MITGIVILLVGFILGFLSMSGIMVSYYYRISDTNTELFKNRDGVKFYVTSYNMDKEKYEKACKDEAI